MPRSHWALLTALLLALTPSRAWAKRIAILAGSDVYEFFPGLSLPGLENSLRELAGLLETRFGYSTKLLLGPQANHTDVANAVTEALHAAQPDDEIIFVYSGHGQGITPDTAKASYLVTWDCDTSNPVKGCLFQSIIADFSRASRARSLLMILDSCFSGAMRGIIMATPLRLEPVAAVSPVAPGFESTRGFRRSREGLGAGSPGQLTWFDGSVGRSYFMSALLAALGTAPAAPHPCVFVKDIASSIREQVRRRSNGYQEPIHYRSSDKDVDGDFFLCLKGTAPQLMTPEEATVPPLPTSAPPERPMVAIVGSGDDYSSYRLAALAATSPQLLDRKLNVDFRTMPITVGFQWEGEGFFRRLGVTPAVIVIHASALHPNLELADRAVAKFQALVRSWLSEMPLVKIVVFSRVPPASPEPGLCRRWERQTSFLLARELEPRVVFFPLAREESSFDGAAGIEITRVIRCEAGLDAQSGCSVFLREVAEKARDMVARSTCAEVR